MPYNFEKRPFESHPPLKNSKSQNSAQNINELLCPYVELAGFLYILEMPKYIDESSRLSK